MYKGEETKMIIARRKIIMAYICHIKWTQKKRKAMEVAKRLKERGFDANAFWKHAKSMQNRWKEEKMKWLRPWETHKEIYLRNSLTKLVEVGVSVEEAMFIYKMNKNITAEVETPVGISGSFEIEVVRQGTIYGTTQSSICTDRINKMRNHIENVPLRNHSSCFHDRERMHNSGPLCLLNLDTNMTKSSSASFIPLPISYRGKLCRVVVDYPVIFSISVCGIVAPAPALASYEFYEYIMGEKEHKQIYIYIYRSVVA